jgi:hypothetical protein
MFWAEWDDDDTPNDECPRCGSTDTEFMGWDDTTEVIEEFRKLKEKEGEQNHPKLFDLP